MKDGISVFWYCFMMSFWHLSYVPYGNIINTNNIATLNKRISDIVRSFKSYMSVYMHSCDRSGILQCPSESNLLSYPGTFEITRKLLAYELYSIYYQLIPLYISVPGIQNHSFFSMPILSFTCVPLLWFFPIQTGLVLISLSHLSPASPFINVHLKCYPAMKHLPNPRCQTSSVFWSPLTLHSGHCIHQMVTLILQWHLKICDMKPCLFTYGRSTREMR